MKEINYRKSALFKIIPIAILLFLIGGYFFWGSRNFLGGPEISIETPINNSTMSEHSLISIVGQSKEAIKILINGREVPVSEDGSFTDSLLLLPKYNIIKITAVDRFEQEKTETLTLFYEPTSI